MHHSWFCSRSNTLQLKKKTIKNTLLSIILWFRIFLFLDHSMVWFVSWSVLVILINFNEHFKWTRQGLHGNYSEKKPFCYHFNTRLKSKLWIPKVWHNSECYLEYCWYYKKNPCLFIKLNDSPKAERQHLKRNPTHQNEKI